jgi:hypothetical protein
VIVEARVVQLLGGLRFSFKLIILLRRIKQGEEWFLHYVLSAIGSLIRHGPIVSDASFVFNQGVAEECTLASLNRHILAVNLDEVADGGTFGLLVINSSDSWMDVFCWDLLNQLTILICAYHVAI